MDIKKLNGLSVLVTRPREQSENLAALIAKKGGNPFIFPTLEIIPVDPDGGWESIAQKLKDTDVVIFTSANAVKDVLSKKIVQESRSEIAAIGTATHAAITEFGIRCDWLPMKDYRSEGLLDLPVFQKIHNKKIIIFAGEGGRDYLQNTLEERGAKVEKIAVYRRICPSPDRTILELFLAQKQPKVIVSTSVESLCNLISLSSGVDDLFSIPLVVVSNRIAVAAREKGFEAIHVAHNASNEQMAVSLEGLVHRLDQSMS